jgi:hypothetical protein
MLAGKGINFKSLLKKLLHIFLPDKMTFALSNILKLGYDDNMPVYLKRKVLPTNTIALILIFCIGLPFVIISLFYFPSMAIVPGLGALTCVVVLIANYLGAIYYSRIFLSLLPLMPFSAGQMTSRFQAYT